MQTFRHPSAELPPEHGNTGPPFPKAKKAPEESGRRKRGMAANDGFVGKSAKRNDDPGIRKTKAALRPGHV